MSGGGGSGVEGDVELNIAPIVDCFTVLIAYLLVSVSFISLQMLNVEISAPPNPNIQNTDPPSKEPPLSLSGQITLQHSIQIKLTGGPKNLNENLVINPAANGKPDLNLLKQKLTELKTAYPTVTEINLSAEPQVQYKEMIDTVQTLKLLLTKVFIAS